MEIFPRLGSTLLPVFASAIVCPEAPHLVEGWYVVRGVGEARPETVGRECDELCLRIYEISLSLSAIHAHAAVEYALRLCLVVDACVIAPSVGGEEESRDVIQLTVGGRAHGILCAIGLAAPGEEAVACASLMLHVSLAPSPQPVEDVFLVSLHGYHHAIRHALGASVIVLYVRHIPHGISYFEVHFVGTVEDIVEDLFHLLFHLFCAIPHLDEYIAVTPCLHRSFVPRSVGLGLGWHDGCRHDA